MQSAMQQNHLTEVPRFHRVALLLFFTALFALVGRGTLMTSDEGGIFNTAVAMTRGSLSVPPGENIHPGRNGQLYSMREILPTVATMPFFVTGVILEKAAGLGSPPLASGPTHIGIKLLDTSNWPLFLTSTLLGSLCGAFTLLYCWEFLVLEGLPQRRVLTLVLIVGWATPIVVYSKTIFPQIFESAVLMLCLLRSRQWCERPCLRAGWKLGVACGLGMLSRSAFLPVVACFGTFLLLAGDTRLKDRLRAVAVFAITPVTAAALILAVNWLKWGSPLDFGHHDPRESFSTNPLTGLCGLLVSPGKGLLIFAPIMLVPIFFARSICKAGRAEFFLMLTVTLVYLGVYSQWYDWGGGLCWGPRFLLGLIAPWMALSGRVLFTHSNIFARRLFWTAATLGAGVQFLGVVVYPHWIYSKTLPNPLSLTTSNIVLTAQAFAQHGVDDLWLTSSAMSREYILVLSVICGMLIGSIALLIWAGRLGGSLRTAITASETHRESRSA